MTAFHIGEDARPPRARDEEIFDSGTASESDLALYLQRLFLPLRYEDGELVVALADASAENIAWLLRRLWFGSVCRGRKRKIDRRGPAPFCITAHRRFHLCARARRADFVGAARYHAGPVRRTASACAGFRYITLVWSAAAARTIVAALSLVFWLIVLSRALLALFGSRAKGDAAGAPNAQCRRLSASVSNSTKISRQNRWQRISFRLSVKNPPDTWNAGTVFPGQTQAMDTRFTIPVAIEGGFDTPVPSGNIAIEVRGVSSTKLTRP